MPVINEGFVQNISSLLKTEIIVNLLPIVCSSVVDLIIVAAA